MSSLRNSASGSADSKIPKIPQSSAVVVVDVDVVDTLDFKGVLVVDIGLKATADAINDERNKNLIVAIIDFFLSKINRGER
mmetsp:Transcript_31533/g.46537  ORF Transcript_31533/g.46537 Transcript_31533/m.46537 type:complete len:81 (-) Transcript_31533:129-371(-)